MSNDELQLTVFISSMIGPLWDERAAVEEAIKTGIPLARTWVFERSPASSEEITESYLARVRECDVYLLILGDDISDPVKDEYRTAVECTKPKLCFVQEGVERTEALKEFLPTLRADVKYATFDDEESLRREVLQAVRLELVRGYRAYRLEAGERLRVVQDVEVPPEIRQELMRQAKGSLKERLGEKAARLVEAGTRWGVVVPVAAMTLAGIISTALTQVEPSLGLATALPVFALALLQQLSVSIGSDLLAGVIQDVAKGEDPGQEAVLAALQEVLERAGELDQLRTLLEETQAIEVATQTLIQEEHQDLLAKLQVEMRANQELFTEQVVDAVNEGFERLEERLERIERLLGADSYSRLKSFSRVSTSYRLLRPRIENYLPRPRLTTLLAELLTSQSVFLHTDAGYGKTWLVHDYVSTVKIPYVWYTIDRDASSPRRFVEELASGFLREVGQAGEKTLTYLYSDVTASSATEALGILLDELQDFGEPSLLIIEDLHNISDQLCITFVEHMLISRPTNLQIILTSRTPLPFGAAKLVAQGSMTILKRQDIAFNLEETDEYVKKCLELKLSEQQVRYLHERIGGWVASLGLAGNALRDVSRDEVDALFEALIGHDGNIYAFFAEEVYRSFDSATRELLKRLSLARTIRPSVVDLFTGQTNGGQILRDLASRNTFLIEDNPEVRSHRLHTLFAEFLQAKLRDENGSQAIQDVHRELANHYANADDWFSATMHAIDGREYSLAVRGLEIIAPVGVNAGYGHSVLSMMERVPNEHLIQSATLQMAIGRANLQTGKLQAALEALELAKKLYAETSNDQEINRAEYLVAEARLSAGTLPRESFVRQAFEIASKAYEQGDALFGTQAELRGIEVGQSLLGTQAELRGIEVRQSLILRIEGLLKELLERCDSLLERTDVQNDTEFAHVKAGVLASQARLKLTVLSFTRTQEAANIRIRENTGHPVSSKERIAMATATITGFQEVNDLYERAEEAAKESGEIPWANIRVQRVRDMANELNMSLLLATKFGVGVDQGIYQETEARLNEQLSSLLILLQQCAEIYAKYHMTYNLALTYCYAAEIYDILGKVEERRRFAQEALALAEKGGFSAIIKDATQLLKGKDTFSVLRASLEQEVDTDAGWAGMDEARKAFFVECFLQAYAGDTDPEEMRRAVEAEVDDNIAVAKCRQEWCQHVLILPDPSHAQSLETMYRTIPKKKIVCARLGHESLRVGYSFDELWPFFKGIYCLTCSYRSLAS